MFNAEPINVLKEALDALEKAGKSPAEVKWVGIPAGIKDSHGNELENAFKCSWDVFCEFAEHIDRFNTSYDEISLHLIISGENWWMERHSDGEFGSSWWEFKSQPNLVDCAEIFEPSDLADKILSEHGFGGFIDEVAFNYGKTEKEWLDIHLRGEWSPSGFWREPSKYGILREHYYCKDHGLYAYEKELEQQNGR